MHAPLSDEMMREIFRNNWLFVHSDDWGDLFEEVTHAIYSYVLDEGDAAIDCGTNIGQHTRAIARACGRTGKVFAVEANPTMMQETRRVASNLPTIEFVERAVWHTADEVKTFHVYAAETGLSSLAVNTGAHTESTAIDVTTTTLDALATTRISLIKMDIEGAEYHALLGAERLLREDKPVIVFEFGRQTTADRFGFTPEEFFSLFERHGYQVYSVAGMPLLRSNWLEPLMPWQFMALHPHSPRTPRAFAATQASLYRLRSSVWKGPA